MSFSYIDTVIYDNFGEMISGWNDRHPDKTAIRYFAKDTITDLKYRDVIQHIYNLYSYFGEKKLSGQHIAIVSENRFEYITIYLAAALDNVIVPLDKELDKETLKDMVKDFDVDVLFYTKKTGKKVSDLFEDPTIKAINIDDEYEKLSTGAYPSEDFFAQVKAIDKDKFSVLASTSGTDGKMKGVMLSQYNIATNVRGTLENNILKSPTLSLLPMNHTYGFNPGILATLYNGTTVCLNLDLKYLLRDIKAFDPFFFEAVPMVFEGIYKNIVREAKKKNRYNLLCHMIKVSNFLLKFHIDLRHILFGNILNKRLRLVVSGGAALNPFYVERFEELGIKLLNGYGMTECSPTIAVSRAANNVVGSAGTIMRHIDVRISDEGEIMVKGPCVMLGYYKNPEATRQSMEGEYLKTGDLGYVADDKVIFVTGRKKNLIIRSNGKNFSPEAVEKKILELPYVNECIVTSRAVKSNEIIVAKVYMEKPADTLDEDIKKINRDLPGFMNIDKVEVMDQEFEKNSTRKIKRNKYAN